MRILGYILLALGVLVLAVVILPIALMALIWTGTHFDVHPFFRTLSANIAFEPGAPMAVVAFVALGLSLIVLGLLCVHRTV